MLFKNNSEKIGWDIGNILLRIWEGCATNCYNCSSNTEEVEYFKYEDFLDSCKYISKNCDTKLDIFFYGTESVYHPEILSFLGNQDISHFNKSLHITPIYSSLNIEKINFISQEYENVSFDTCYTIKDLKSLLWVLKYLKYVIDNDIKSTLDLFFDYNKFAPHILRFLRMYDIKWKDKSVNTHIWYNNCVEFIYNERQIILLYDLKQQNVVDKRVTNLQNTNCIAKNSIDIVDKEIYISEEVEFTKKWEITVHLNTYCSKWINRISHISKANEEIIDDFKKLDWYLEKFNSWDMWKNCYNCMTKEYNYD